MSRPRLLALLLALGTLVVFLPVVGFGFVNYDDDDYVTANPMVRRGLSPAGIQWAFTTGHASNWHPLTWLSHLADVSLFGLNPGPHHFVSVLWHAANTALLLGLLWRLTQKIWPSAFAAALFAWHPLHVESVAWIAERKDVLSTFFALLTLLGYLQFVALADVHRLRSRGYFGLSLVFFALGLMAKPMLVTLPLVMLLLDHWPLNRFPGPGWKRVCLEKTPFFLLAAASCLVTFCVQHSGHAVISLETVPLSLRLENAPVAVARYLLELVWPAGLAVLYPLAAIPPATLLLAVAVLAGLSVLAWWRRRHEPYYLTGWLWFLGTLVPVIGLVQVGSAALADRYTYLPSIGIFLALALGLEQWTGWLSRPLRIAGATLVLAACVGLTEHQLHFWRDSEALFRRALAVTHNNDVAHANLGRALDEQGRTSEALLQYRAAVRLDPDRYQTHFNLGRDLGLLGQPAEALVEFRQCLRCGYDTANVHQALGDELAALGQSGEALQEFALAAQRDPRRAAPHLAAAQLLYQQARDAAAVAELQTALQVEPDDYSVLAMVAHYLAANENAAARDGQAALRLGLRANELSGHTQPLVFDVLGMAFAENGDFTNAILCAQNAQALASAARLKKTEPIQVRLELYQKHQPWRESFRAPAGGK